VAFTVPNGGGSDIQVADVRGGAPIHVTTDGASNASPTWFPDGGTLAFVSSRDQHPGIWKVSRFGGSPTFVLGNAASPAISPDGQRIAFARCEGGSYMRIWVAPLDNPAKALRITSDSDGVWNHAHPAWSPDGRIICYNDQNDIWVVPGAGGKARRLTADEPMDSDPVWSPDGRHVYFESWRMAGCAIWRVPSRGGPLERVTLGTAYESSPSLAADGKRLAYVTAGPYSCVLVDRTSPARNTLSTLPFTGEPAFSPDGTWLACTMQLGEGLNIWKVRLNHGRPEGEPERLTDQQGNCANVAVSPDGRWITYHRVFEGQRHVWVVPASGGPPVSFTEGTGSDDQPEWSPDGREISFISNRGGHDQIWAALFRDGHRVGEPRAITGGYRSLGIHCWSPDGKRVAFILDDGSGADVWITDAAGTAKPVRLTRGVEPAWLTADPSSGDLLVIGKWGSARHEVRRLSPDTGESRTVPEITVSSTADLCEVEASPDGKLMALIEQETLGDIWMLEAKSGNF
jgi:TolB protein